MKGLDGGIIRGGAFGGDGDGNGFCFKRFLIVVRCIERSLVSM